MHEIEPYHNWLRYYDQTDDPCSPFFGKEYNYDLYSENIYGYYIDPAWDYMGSETLYIKILFIDDENGFCIIEMIGEWNDALNNDIMHLKRNILECLLDRGINKYILIGENVFNFHGSDDCYYEEWFDEVEDGWIAAINFRDFVTQEMAHYNIDSYVSFGGQLDLVDWRTRTPAAVCQIVDGMIRKRLSMPPSS